MHRWPNRSLPGLALILALLISACTTLPQRGKQTDLGNEHRSDTPVSIRVALYEGGPSVRMDVLTAAFQAKYPQYRVEKIAIQPGRQAVEEARAKIQQGELDLIFAGMGIHGLATSKLLMPLDTYIQKDNVDMAPYRSFIDQLQRDGKLYELPYDASPLVLVYNKDLTAAAGVTIPRDSWTWEQFRETARQLRSEQGEKQIWGFAPSFYEPLSNLWLKQSQQATGWTEDQAVYEAFRYFDTLLATDKSMPPQPVENVGKEPSSFLQGQAAIGLEYLASMTTDAPPGFAWDLAPFPTLPGAKPVLHARFESYAIAHNSHAPDAAWAFLRFMAGPEGAMALARAGYLPFHPSPEARKVWLERASGLPANARTLLDTTWVTYPRALLADTMPRLLFDKTRDVMMRTTPWEAAAKFYAEEAVRIRAGVRSK